MQQDNNDMEKKLRQLENQQIPDLSRMDEHWENMSVMLKPPAATGGRSSGISKWFWLLGLVVLTGAIIFYLDQEGKKDPSVNEIKQPATTTNTVAQAPVEETKLPGETMGRVETGIKRGKTKKNDDNIDNVSIPLPVQLNVKDSSLITVTPDKQKMLNELFAELAKTAQEFRIDNSRDTLLQAAEGSSLFIPANSLGGSREIKISLKEFYKTGDIVLNKLSTTSNGQQLITGGMVHISATVNDKPVNVLPGKQIKIYMPDTSGQMEQMQLFTGQENKDGRINWINSDQYFGRPTTAVEVWVLDTRNEPFKTIERKKGLVGVFVIDGKRELSRSKLRELLKQKYGYYKVRFRKSRNNLKVSGKLLGGITYSTGTVGDSAWVDKAEVDKYKLEGTQSRTYTGISITSVPDARSILRRGYIQPQVDIVMGGDTALVAAFEESMMEVQKRYSVNIRSLGWINCDRFYADPREKIDYVVRLNDSAVNFYTMLVFDNIRSMMTGFHSGNEVMFSNVPTGEPVKIISIGINKTGETVMAMKETKISKVEFAGLEFEASSAAAIRSSLNKTD